MRTAPRTARLTLTALALTATLALTACGEDEPDTGAASTGTPEETVSPSGSSSESASPSESASAPANAVEVTIKGDSVTPVAQSVEVGVGEPVVLDITSDRAGELHAHSVPEQTVQVKEGRQTVEMTFERPGQVDIEEHGAHALVVRVLVR
jgi:plastocyanin